jgi:TolB-like protein
MMRMFFIYIALLLILSACSIGDIKEEGTIVNTDKPVTVAPEEISGAGKGTIALLPFDNFSGNRDALLQIMPILKYRLKTKGYEIVDMERLNDFLCKRRVRSTGYVSNELALNIKKEFMAETILAGAVISFAAEKNPRFGIMARLIDASSGTILWADYASATGYDFTTILGFGRLKTVSSLIPKVMDRLFASFSTNHIHDKTAPSYKIAVMPLQNNSRVGNAGIIVMYMFLTELLKNEMFEPVEYGDVRKLIVDSRIRSKGELEYKNIQALSKSLDTRGILVGVVDLYSDGLDVSSAPSVSITARLLDGHNNKILWYNNFHLSGDNDIILLDWGRIRSVHRIAYKAVSGLLQKMMKTKGL